MSRDGPITAGRLTKAVNINDCKRVSIDVCYSQCCVRNHLASALPHFGPSCEMQTGVGLFVFFLFFFSPNPMIGRIGKDRALAKQSLLRWPCPLPSDRTIPGLWQNLESKV